MALSRRQRSTVKALWEMHHPKVCQPYLHLFLCSRVFFFLFAVFVVFLIFCFFFPIAFGEGVGQGGVGGCVCVFVCIVIFWWFMPFALCLWDPRALLMSRVSRDGSDKAGSVGVEAQR